MMEYASSHVRVPNKDHKTSCTSIFRHRVSGCSIYPFNWTINLSGVSNNYQTLVVVRSINQLDVKSESHVDIYINKYGDSNIQVSSSINNNII